MRQKWRIRPEVIDRARDRLGETSDERLAVRLGMTGTTLSRIRSGAQPSLPNAVSLLRAASVSVEAGLVPADKPAA